MSRIIPTFLFRGRMKKLLLLVYMIAVVSVAFADGWRKGEMQVMIYLNTPDDGLVLKELRINADVYGPEFNTARAYVVPAELEKIKQAGLSYEIEIEDLNKRSQDSWSNRDSYHSYQEIVDVADSLAEYFPGIVKKVLYGYSVDNRQCFALKISDNVNIDEPEPEVMFDGGIHGDEHIAAEILVRFARDIVLDYGTNATVTDLINTREIWLYLMVNPDGRVEDSRYNVNGVDLNRDWQYMWDAWGGSPGPCSQPESKHLRECMYNNQFVVHTTYHSGTEYISCPWSYRPPPCPDNDHIMDLAGVYASTSLYSSLDYGPGFNGMYAINGSTKDSNYGIMGAISWSMEISYIKEPPTSQIMLYYNRNYPAMIAMIEYAGYGIQGIITDAVTGDPIEAAVFVDDGLPCFSDSTAGDFHKYLIPGTYSVKVIANGYEMQTVSGVEVNAGSATQVDFQLQPQDGQFAYRFTASQIPNNNHDDEGNTKAVIGPPDNINYSIGKYGWCVLDMQFPVADGPGPDIRIHEGDASPEGYTCYAGQTMDGPWFSLGAGTGTTEFDIAEGGIPDALFIKLVDDGDGTANANDAGFDLDAIEVLEGASGVYLAMFEYEVDDSSGNNNGKIDPGETVDIIVTLKNNGDVTAENVTGTITTASTYINIITSSANFGNIGSYQTGEGTFTVEASASTPAATPVDFDLDVTSNNGTYNNNFIMSFVVGQIPAVVIDLDGNHNSGTEMNAAIQVNGVTCEYMLGFPADLNLYSSVFLCLGIYNDNHILTTSQGQQLADYLNNGGMLYMEGGDTWYYDDQTAVHPMFNINATGDGSADLGTINGQSGTFTDGMSFNYSGDNSWVDRIEPISPAVKIFQNQSPAYGTGVAHDEGSYRTIGCSHEFGGLDDGNSPSTKEELMHQYLLFFGIMPENIQANFTADDTDICEGETVQFTDNSFGNITSWSWEFEGGNPATSTEQNPSVQYNTTGSYDVTLTVSDGTDNSTITKEDFITVSAAPGMPGTPEGPVEVCTNLVSSSEYTTGGSAGASSYEWELQPQDAGTISGTGTTSIVEWTLNWEGTAHISVKAINDCGESPFSDALEVTCEVCVGMDENLSAENQISILPNPTKGAFTIVWNEKAGMPVSIEISDLNGRVIYKVRMVIGTDGTLKIDPENIHPGVFVIRISEDDSRVVKKLVIE